MSDSAAVVEGEDAIHRQELWHRSATLYRRANIGSAVVFGVLGVAMVISGLNYGVIRQDEIGSGFFPVVLGSVFTVLSVLWLAQPKLRRLEPHDAADEDSDLNAPDHGGLVSMGGTILACVLAMILMPFLGFQITMAVFVISLLKLVAKKQTLSAIIMGLVFSVGTYWVFVGLLGVPLPVATLFPLNVWGL